MDKQLIIITIPHSLCIKNLSEKGHSCDFIALKAAKKLADVLSNDKRVIQVYPASINRTEMDLNRIQSFHNNYRIEIRHKIEAKIQEIIASDVISNSRIIYIIDCHSFPQYSFANISIDNPDVAILMADCRQLDYIEELTDLLKRAGILVTKHLGSSNSIIEEYYMRDQKVLNSSKDKIRIIPILVEFNENLSDDKISIICNEIYRWIDTINDYVINSLKNKVGNLNGGYYYKYVKYKVKYLNLKKLKD